MVQNLLESQEGAKRARSWMLMEEALLNMNHHVRIESELEVIEERVL